MANYITIDSGTTNTRVFLVSDGKVISCEKIRLGTRDNITHDGRLESALHDVIGHFCGMMPVSAVILSGMIGSEHGLCEIKHISAPAGVHELHNAIVQKSFPEISDVPFFFIPGVIKRSGAFTDCDIMRGEETEIFGLSAATEPDTAYILPGSHTKIVYCDENGRICDFSTFMTGELIDAVTSHTLVGASVTLGDNKLCDASLKEGYEYAKEAGISEALFKTRIKKNFFDSSADEVYSYFMGVCLSGEIDSLRKREIKKAVVGGREQIKNALCILLSYAGIDAVAVSPEIIDSSVCMGAVRIFENE